MLLLVFCLPALAGAQQTSDIKIEKPEQYGAAPGAYTAEFRLRLPVNKDKLKYVIVLVPGYNNDGREWADDREWQVFADEEQCAILACYFTVADNAPQHYNVVETWSGKALLDVLRQYSEKTKISELEKAPLLLWGFSAGSGFSYNIANWKPERVAAFVAGKSTFNTADPQAAVLKIPGLFIAGENDKERINIIVARYNSGRHAGALWCYAVEPGIGHYIGKSPSLGRAFFKAVIARRERMAAGSADAAWIGNLKDFSIRAKGDQPVDTQIHTWLPDEMFAKAWQWVVSAGKMSNSSRLRFYTR